MKHKLSIDAIPIANKSTAEIVVSNLGLTRKEAASHKAALEKELTTCFNALDRSGQVPARAEPQATAGICGGSAPLFQQIQNEMLRHPFGW